MATVVTPSAHEQLLLELINADRQKAGAAPLKANAFLDKAATAHSAWMLSVDTFSHTGSGKSTPGDRMKKAGYVFSGSWTWGENIAWGTTRKPVGLMDEIKLLHAGLMNSPGHRANLLSTRFKDIGLGFVVGEYRGREAAFLTENFAKTGSGRTVAPTASLSGGGISTLTMRG